MIEQDAEMLINIQKTLSNNPYATQRILAENSDISLGQMNAILRRCAERGWIAIKNLNMKKVCYCLTTEGMEEISRRSSLYVKHSFEMMNEYAEKIENMIQKAKCAGKTKVVLVGDSNIQFIIEWACERNEMEFIIDCCMMEDDSALVICGELSEEDLCKRYLEQGAVSVMEI